MATEADRIAELERKVASLQDRLDWALLASQWLLRRLDIVIKSPGMSSAHRQLESVGEGYTIELSRLDEFVEKSLQDSFEEQKLSFLRDEDV